jgi:hypothetical protein
MLPPVEAAETCHEALEAVCLDHLGQAMSMRAQLMTVVTALRQGHKQSVKNYVAEGRQYLVHLREVGVEQPATLLIPCFEAGIDARMTLSALPLLNQEHLVSDLKPLRRSFSMSQWSFLKLMAAQVKQCIPEVSKEPDGNQRRNSVVLTEGHAMCVARYATLHAIVRNAGQGNRRDSQPRMANGRKVHWCCLPKVMYCPQFLIHNSFSIQVPLIT